MATSTKIKAGHRLEMSKEERGSNVNMFSTPKWRVPVGDWLQTSEVQRRDFSWKSSNLMFVNPK